MYIYIYIYIYIYYVTVNIKVGLFSVFNKKQYQNDWMTVGTTVITVFT